MATVYTNATIYDGQGRIDNGFIRYEDTILNVGPMSEYTPTEADEEIDAEGRLIIPGFIDVHSHGGYGIDNMDADPEKIDEMVQQFLQEGITSYFATTMTQTAENVEASVEAIAKAAEHNDRIVGIHIEGPFISVDHMGAQNPEFITPPSKDLMKKWNELSGDLIRLVTYAPEVTDVSEFEAYCLEHDIVLSVGHSGATYAELEQSNATHVTHLYNGQLGLHHREPGVTGYGLLNDDVKVEMIVDGHHICPEMVKLTYRAKGADGIVLITDAMRAKGLPNGESELGGQKVFVKDGTARLENGSLAGSILTFIDAFRNIIAFSGCSIEEAVKMSSTNQAEEFNLAGKGQLLPGYDADFLVLSTDLELQQTIYGGETYNG